MIKGREFSTTSETNGARRLKTFIRVSVITYINLVRGVTPPTCGGASAPDPSLLLTLFVLLIGLFMAAVVLSLPSWPG